MVKECTNGKMDNLMKDNFLKGKNMAQGSIFGKILVIMKEIGYLILLEDSELFNGLMEDPIKVNGKTI